LAAAGLHAAPAVIDRWPDRGGLVAPLRWAAGRREATDKILQ
jgi:hypothetical protein